MEKYIHQFRDIDIPYENVRTRKNKINTYEKYSTAIMTFDIEVSSAWIDNGEVIGYTKGKKADYWNSLIPLALPYIWQFSYNGTVYYGRELWDFEEVLKDIPSDIHIIIWVHNLAYEFQFLCNFLEWDNVFARSPHKPIKCVPSKYKNIEFRCTYMLTRLSLDTWGKQIGKLKATGELDYEILRTPLTPLTEQELFYCEQDCLVVEAGIKEYIKKYKTQRNIPLTQTGTVRRETKTRLMCDKIYSSHIKKLVPRNADEYKILQTVFAGGYTHANKWYSGRVVRGKISHYDFASSYPTVMIAEKYPMTPWVYTAQHVIPNEETFNDWAYIMYVEFSQLKSISFNTYIQASKSIINNGIYDNGRVISADKLSLWITEQDYITIKNNYEWKDIKVIHLYRSKKDYLPRNFTNYILELYKNKTELKEVVGMEDLYMQSKQYINSLFGMSVTAIVQANVEFKDDLWTMEKLTKEYVNKKLDNLRFPNPREKKYFLSYSWGVYVTAYARRNLWKCIEYCDDDMIYCDTDSIFVLGDYNFDWYNKEITEKIRKACEIMNLDFNATRPKTKKGIEKPLGVFAAEDECTEFITLGAKRYVERRATDNKLHLTVSGINKEAVALLNDDIENFTDGFDFDKDSDCVTKRLSTYINEMPITIWNDGYVSTYTHGINLRRTGYLLTLTDEYKELINFCEKNIKTFDEEIFIHYRGKF